MVNRHKLILLLLLIAGLAFNFLTWFIWDPSLIANDGVQSLSTAENWLKGLGFSTNALVYAPHFQGTLPAIQTVWPPGIPFLIALISKAGLDLKTALLLLNLITHAMATLVMWLILRRMGIESFFAAICAFFFYAMALPWAYVSAGLTEPVFTTLALGSLLLLPDPKQSNPAIWIGCGALIACCIYIRYSGVFVAFGTGAGIFAYIVAYERRSIAGLVKHCLKLSLLVALPSIAFLYLMQRTYHLIGTLDRYSGSKMPDTLAATLKKWAVKASDLTGFNSINHTYSWFSTLSFCIFVILVISIVLLFFFDKINTKSAPKSNPTNQTISETAKQTDYFRLFWMVAAFQGLSLIVYLTASNLNTTPLEIITRYLYQFYPGFYAIFCFMLYTVVRQSRSGKKQTLVTIVTSMLAAIYLLAQLNSLRVSWPTYFNDAKNTVELMNLPVRNSTNLKSYIEKCYSDGNVGNSIWSPHAQPIHLHTGIPSLSQISNYTDRPFDAKDFQDRINQYKIGMFVFTNYLEFTNKKHDAYMEAAKNWLANSGYQQVAMQQNTFGDNRTVELYSASPQCDAS